MATETAAEGAAGWAATEVAQQAGGLGATEAPAWTTAVGSRRVCVVKSSLV